MLVERTFEADTTRLYGSIAEAISYLREIEAEHFGKDISLTEVWTGYEDMYLAFTYMEEETEEEKRLREYQKKIKEREAKEKRRYEDQKKKDMAEYRRLKQKLGVL